MKISKKVRDEAILICLCAASSESDDEGLRDCNYWGIGAGLELSVRAQKVAHAAWLRVYGVVHGAWSEESGRFIDAEAAQLLEDGWCPGDPVVLLRGGG